MLALAGRRQCGYAVMSQNKPVDASNRPRRPASKAAYARRHPVVSGQLPWRMFDEKFLHHRLRYILQCLLATLVILLVMLLLDTVTQTVLISAFGASTFICFSMPHVRSSGSRYIIGGYIVGTVIGGFASQIADSVVFTAIPDEAIVIVFGALATGLAIFAMVLTNTEHPPAAALALGYVLNEWDLMTMIAILVGIVLISTAKEVTRKWMIDLL